MKFLQKMFATLLLTAMVHLAQAQYCGNSGPSVCTAGTNLTAPGFSPPPDSIPCVIQGVAVSQVIQVKIPTSILYSGVTATITSLKLDTISNLPCGLCWATENANNTFPGSSQFCIKVTGTTYDNPGQFNLRIIVDAGYSALGGLVTGTMTNVNASTAGLNFYVRVQTPTGVCAPPDTNAGFVGNTTTPIGAAPSNAVTAGGALTFCQGGSVVLTATQTGAQYQWYNGANAIANATNRTYTATTSGSYTVNVIANCHLVISTPQTVVVNPSPTAAITPAGPFNLCGGSTEPLTATVSGGTWQWYNGTTSIGGSTGGSYTATATGSYYVIAVQNGCSDTSNKVSVTISGTPLSPSITPNRTSECAGAKDTLNAGGGYSSYTWSGSLGSSQYAYPLGGGTYTVTVANGACTGSASVVINSLAATPTPTITPSGTITLCQGQTQTLTSSSANSYLWSAGGGNAITQSVTVTPAVGTSTVNVTTNNGCGPATSTNVTFQVNAKPAASVTPTGPVIVCGGGTQLLTATGGGTYQWLNNNAPIGGQTGSTYTAAATGNYSCIVTANGCFDTSNIVNVQITGSNLTPTITPSRTFVCPTGLDTLDVGTGYTSYLWSANAGSAATHSVTITASGTYTVTVHNGACSGTGTINISSQTATPTPTITPQSATTFCQGGSVILTSSAPSTNVWSGGGGTGTTATYTSSGSYTVTTNNGCGAATSAPTTVTVNQIPNAAITPAGYTLICSNGSQTLTATPAGGSYVWIESGSILGGQTASTTSATTAGTYRAIVTVSGCSDTSNTATIQVGAPITPTIAATSPAICGGQSDTLNVGTGYSTYTWGNSLGSGPSIVVNSGGTYDITVANGSCTGSATITINQGTAPTTPTISVTAGSNTICGNDSVTLTSSSQSNNVWSNSATTQSITEYNSGVFTVSNTNGCGTAISAPDTVTKTTISTVNAGPDTGACIGSTLVLSASTTASSIVWSNGTTTALDTVSTSGEYYVTVTQGGCSSNDSVHVTFDQIPPATFTYSNDTLLAAAGGISYQWYQNGSAIPGATGSMLILTATGSNNYKVAVTFGYCTVVSAIQLVTWTGISDISQNLSTKIYPNPTNNEVTISYSLTSDLDLDITLTDLMGRTIKHLYTGTQQVGVYNIETDLSPYTGGIYLINFTTPEGTLVRKITKE